MQIAMSAFTAMVSWGSSASQWFATSVESAPEPGVLMVWGALLLAARQILERAQLLRANVKSVHSAD